MCGITGFYGFEDKPLLKKMTLAIEHRGPDDYGFYTDKNISLGHRRLSIIDLSKAGHQPMTNEDGSIWLVFNGEIYNFLELREQLLKAGHKFSSNTDTECIIHGYEEWGELVVSKLHGMFAFAIWDSKKDKLILARDRIGIKPLYYTWQGDRLLFASEIKAILEAPFIKREVNLQAFYDYLTYINTPAPHTLFKGIKKLKPGHIMIVEKAKSTIKQYWNILDFSLDSKITESQAVEKTKTLLEDSIKQRMLSDVPQGVFLSGGVDSSAITALMAKASDSPVNTFSIATGAEGKYNELPFARMVAEKYETNHTEFHIGIDDVVSFLPDLIHYEDEPIGDPVNVPVYYLAKKARESGVIVLQVGEGADELFCGYPPYKLELMAHKIIKPLVKMPTITHKAGLKLATAITRMKGKDAHRLLEDQISRAKKGEDFPWHGLLAFTETEKHRHIVSKDFLNQNPEFDSYNLFRDISRSVSLQDSPDIFLQKERIIEIKNRLSELLLMRVDKFTMATSIEARVPFLDHRLVEFELRVLPNSIHMKPVFKNVLKKAIGGLLPQEIIRRKKVGFGVPVAEHFATNLKDLAYQEFSNPELSKLLNVDYAKSLLENHQTKKFGDTSFRTWILLNFALWYRYWIQQEKIKL